MIAADTSTWIAFLRDEPGADCEQLDRALANNAVAMPPVVLAELFSRIGVAQEAVRVLEAVPVLEILPGYWRRAGELRARVLALGRRARLGDALIAQSCLDHGMDLITRDSDFRAFAAAGGLKLGE